MSFHDDFAEAIQRGKKRQQKIFEETARARITVEKGADFAGVTVFDSVNGACDVCGSPDYLAWDGVWESLYECLGCGAAESQYDYRSRSY
jgi:hypothetical protein